jgi:hypothetical protein
VLSTEQEAKIDLLATKAKQDLLLAELELKANLNETQTVSVATLPLPSGAATSTKQSDGTQKTQIVDSDGTVADVVQLGTQVTSSDKGIVTNTVIHGLNSAGGGSYVDVKVTPSGALTIEANAGDDLNTSLLALEAGGNLEDIASNTIKGLP